MSTRTKRISKMEKFVCASMATCNSFVQRSGVWALGSTASSRCTCRITNFPGDHGHEPLPETAAATARATEPIAEPLNSMSGNIFGIIVKRSIWPNGRLPGCRLLLLLLQLLLHQQHWHCSNNSCSCAAVCNFLINAIMSWLFSWPRLMHQCLLPACTDNFATLNVLWQRRAPNCTHVCNLFSRHKNFLTGKWALN